MADNERQYVKGSIWSKQRRAADRRLSDRIWMTVYDGILLTRIDGTRNEIKTSAWNRDILNGR